MKVTTNVKQILNGFKKATDSLGNKNGVNLLYVGVRLAVFRHIGIIFDKQVTPDGVPWVPMRETTKSIREALGFKPLPLLQRSGALLESLTKVQSGQIRQSSQEVVVGTNLKYARLQQYGFGNVVARPYLGFSDAMIREVKDASTRGIKSIMDSFFMY